MSVQLCNTQHTQQQWHTHFHIQLSVGFHTYFWNFCSSLSTGI